MSKARSMYAGSSGSNYSVNKNSPGNGNHKWQGLPPTVGHAGNARHINIEAGGNNRNVVFCMNQLGGVGRISNMFATTADGIKDCKPSCKIDQKIVSAINILKQYVRTYNQQNSLTGVNRLGICLRGQGESLFTDHITDGDGFQPIPTSAPTNVINAVSLINNLNITLPVNGDPLVHEVALVSVEDASKLVQKNYAVRVLCNNMLAFGDCYGGDVYACICDGEEAGCEDGLKGSPESAIPAVAVLALLLL